MRVHFYAMFREVIGEKCIEVDLADGATVQQLLDRIFLECPGLRTEMLDEDGLLSHHVHIFVNGRSSRFLDRGLATPLRARDDRIDFFPAVAGG